MPNEIPIVFHNGSQYDYHFIRNELAKEFEVHLNTLGENNEIFKRFYARIKKEITKTEKDREKKTLKTHPTK